MKAESASLKIGLTNGTGALQSLEMVTNDLAQMNDIVIRLEEIHALGSNGFTTAEDTTALSAEATSLLTEMSRISAAAKWKGNAIIKQSATDTTTNTMNFGRNNSSINIVLDQFKIPEVALGFNKVGDAIYGDIDISSTASSTGTAYATTTTTPVAVAARTLADTKLNDVGLQSALAVNGAVFFEHLTAAGQAKLAGAAGTVPVAAEAAAVSAKSGAVIAATTAVTIGGTRASGGSVTLTTARQVTIQSDVASETAIFTVVGTDRNGDALTEAITSSAVKDEKATGSSFFLTIASVTNNAGASVGKITVGLGTLTPPAPIALAGSDIGKGSAEAALALLALKTVVDKMNISAGTLYNKVSNTMSHMGSLNAGYQLDVASKMDVDFAGETALLAKGQILAQAGTAMLAQANAQQQSVLALLQS